MPIFRWTRSTPRPPSRSPRKHASAGINHNLAKRQSYGLSHTDGAHCAVLHPWFLAVAWSKLYGFPWDVRLWASFCLHDIGYISKPNMDGSEGETHVELGARIMGLLFGESWAAFTAAHSRYWAKRNGRQFSRLCVADKLAFVLTPAWLYLPMTRATGELSEYSVLPVRLRRAAKIRISVGLRGGGRRFGRSEAVGRFRIC